MAPIQTLPMPQPQLFGRPRINTGRECRNKPPLSPGPDEVLVNLKFSGLCHSALHQWRGNHVTRKKHRVDGHEGTGVVVATGNEVEDIKIGDHVGIQWINRTCGVCDADKQSDFVSCPHARMTGYSVDGTFREYCISQACHVVRLPKQIPLDVVAPIICVGTTCFRTVQESGAQPGSLVAVAGPPGGLTTLTCQYAKARGYRVLVISTGVYSNHLYKQKLGVEYYIDYNSSANMVAEVQGMIDDGPDAAILIEGSGALLKGALQYVQPRGTVVVVGLPPGTPIGIDISKLVSRMAQVKVIPYGGTREQIEKAILVFTKERFYQPCHVFALDQLPQILHSMQNEIPKGTYPGAPLRYGSQLLGEAVIKIPDAETIPEPQVVANLPSSRPTFNQTTYNIGTFLAYRFEELDIRDYFAVPGDTNFFLLDNLLKNPNLRMVTCCNELNAGYAADGYARVSPAHIAIIVVPYIVGSLSVLNAVSGACSQNIRLIVLSGCPTTSLVKSDKFLHHAPSAKNKDQALRAFEGVTAASVRLESAETASDVLDDTIGKCLDSSMPVYIEVPNDLASAACARPSPLSRKVNLKSQPRVLKEAVEAITSIWNSSQRPVLLLGSLAGLSLPRGHIERLAEKLGCAVLCQPDGRCFKESHPQYCGQFWAGMVNPEGEQIVMSSDLWLVIGGNWSDFHVLMSSNKQEHYRIISVDKDWVELPEGKHIKPAKIGALVAQLIMSGMETKTESIPRPKPLLGCLPPGETETPETPLTLKSAISCIQGLIKEHDTLLCDAGESWLIANHILLPHEANCQLQFPYCSISWALPAGFGSQLAWTQGRSIILIGDGGFQMTAQETAMHDGPYNYLANWDYVQLANSFSSKPHAPSHNPYASKEDEELEDSPPMFAMKIKTIGDLKQALDRVDAESDKLAFLELCIQPDDITDDLRRLGKMIADQSAEGSENSQSSDAEESNE
ncbi:pyruvate decarboxylase [Aspergillus neoniger CBS 115656]|uniref:pyruvate decarboxylase n=1 Tax=Aspergillus neoniger (strain CBS 115656) TaxID=1448310 RepID=A0A318Y266_ASPNB|nr:pyruvate decarboxylase [Aspergillus neoniger CBS 115656]PYH28446.1 pyruvate decarboxylase [Aspergillus neoniger CBS 115656]